MNRSLLPLLIVLGLLWMQACSKPPSGRNTLAAGVVASAALLYAQQHDGHFPSDLFPLIDGNYITLDFVVGNHMAPEPSVFAAWPADQRQQWINDNATYVLITQGIKPGASDAILAIERPVKNPLSGRLEVGWADGRWSHEPVERIHDLLMRQTGQPLIDWIRDEKP